MVEKVGNVIAILVATGRRIKMKCPTCGKQMVKMELVPCVKWCPECETKKSNRIYEQHDNKETDANVVIQNCKENEHEV